MRPVSVYDIRGAGRRGQRTWRLRSCRRPGTPTAAATPASDSVRVSSVSAGTVESRLRARSSDPASPARGRRRGRREARHGGSRAGIRSRRSPDRRSWCLTPGTGSSRPPRRAGRPTRARADRTASTGRGAARPALRAASVEVGETALREQRPRAVERTAERRAPADRHDLRSGVERVQPLRCRRHPGADDRDASTRIRAARRRAPRSGRHSSGHASPGWPVATRRARTARRRPARTLRRRHGSRSTRRSVKLRSQPLRSRSRSTCARKSSTRGW